MALNERIRKSAPEQATADFFVSPSGNDAWSGKLSDAGQNDGPFATIERARDAVRARLRSKEQHMPIRVIIRGSTYFLSQPLEFGPEDSGAPDAPITYAAAAGERVVVSGGQRLDGGRWGEVNGQKAWVVDIPEVKEGKWFFRQLFVNGKRCLRPRLPKEGNYLIESVPDYEGREQNEIQGHKVRRFVFSGADIQPWHNLKDVEIVVFNKWVPQRLPVQEVDMARRIAMFDRETCWGLSQFRRQGFGCYWAENILEALSTPGEWYLDRPEGRLYYLPREGEDPSRAEMIAPRLTQLVRFAGSREAPVQYILFEGISFSHTEWYPKKEWSGNTGGPWPLPGAMELNRAKHCQINLCSIEHTGAHAIEIGEGSFDCEIIHNRIAGAGADGVCIKPGSGRSIIADNEICECGRISQSGMGVRAMQSVGNKILYNHIHDLHYIGIAIAHGEGDKTGGNVIEHNHVHHLGQEGLLDDMGCIYSHGASPGTVIRFNVVHDVRCRLYGAWGIYADDKSADILIEKNLAYGFRGPVYAAPFMPQVDIRNVIVRNNIFAFGETEQVTRRPKAEEAEFVFQRNIVYHRRGKAQDRFDPLNQCRFDFNIYWNASGEPTVFGDKSFAEWQATGMDLHSIIADPLFKDPENGDFRLKPGSPAAQIGFEPWNLSDVGPR